MGEGTTCPPLAVPLGDAASDAKGDAGEAGPPPIVGMRLANLSPTAPLIDFCIAPAGTQTFGKPMLAALAAALADAGNPIDAAVPGLAFPQVSAYTPAPPGAYNLRIVVAGASDCSTGLADAQGTLFVPGGGFATVALIGEALPTPTLQVVAYPDDTTPPPPKPDGGSLKLYLRLLHAAPGQPPVNMGIDPNGKGAKPIFDDVAYGQVSTSDAAAPMAPDATALKVDNNGYLVTSALQCGANGICPKIVLRPTGALEGGLPLATGTVTAAAGAVLSVSLVGDTVGSDAGSGGGAPLGLLECVDNAATTGLYGNCATLPP
jgi:hypothetical protein